MGGDSCAVSAPSVKMEGTTGRVILGGSVGSRVGKFKVGQVAQGYAMQDAAMIPS